ncbi:DUF7683 domain-containing protein [Avibacterium paragallinarum]|uniref:DUF7683 domain-containing protein n=1 Tax=Avibacterium paragallinarum TaxID=728 RepID=UPI00021AD2B4|nr:hypothetical protein [Avibacterium paragallinarum]QIR12152.1 hypothetical protein HBL79_07910 [Avibacterium paragallinarum]QJE09026.1 hypothetical protein HHJ62_01130 [Avibacterium paragallinarum]QJE11223.1 hypothetical protein HHJ61_01130 [Avibacterium paragallinarum]QJE13421.1 hypothetical protein HHJ60_01135 [Avibacterium paragallinarum]QJE15621.1 hypothetical protein HHJ59_01125 [Avibacterium paragallinarum]
MIEVTRYIEVYDNVTEELIDSYEITLPDEEAIFYINPDDDDRYAIAGMYMLNLEQVINLGGSHLVSLYNNKDVSFYAACFQK